MIVVRIIAAAIVLLGLAMILFGKRWGNALFDKMPATELYNWLSLGVPFIPLFLLGIGACLYVRTKKRPD